MAEAKDITDAEFESAVLERSKEIPVLGTAVAEDAADGPAVVDGLLDTEIREPEAALIALTGDFVRRTRAAPPQKNVVIVFEADLGRCPPFRFT